MWGFRAEPAAVAEFIRLALIAVIGFGLLNWTVEQQAMVLAVVSAGLSFFVRQNVTSQETLKKAGTSQAQVEAVAADDSKKMSVRTVSGA